MKNVIPLIVMLFCINSLFSQSTSPAIILISASSSPEYIGEMKESLKNSGLIFNVEKEVWKNSRELSEFAFTITNEKTKLPKSFEFKYNELNRHQIFLVYPNGKNEYAEVMTDVSYLKSDILSIVISNEVKRMKPILHRSYGKSGNRYRQSIVLTDLKNIESKMSETVALYKSIKADQMIGKSISGLTYTYNGEYLQNPAGINLHNMTADVLIESLEDDSQIINIWSDEPLNEIISGITLVGQR